MAQWFQCRILTATDILGSIPSGTFLYIYYNNNKCLDCPKTVWESEQSSDCPRTNFELGVLNLAGGSAKKHPNSVRI